MGTKWWMSIPPGCDRIAVERRLWFLFAAKNYHYPTGSSQKREFSRKARQVLSQSLDAELSPEEATARSLRDHNKFSKNYVKGLPINAIDRHLTVLGIWANVTENDRRKMLWQWYNLPPSSIPGGKRREMKNGRLNNKYCLRDIIIENPECLT